MAYLPNTKYSYEDSANLDAFGRLRISDTYTIFDSKVLNYDYNSIFYDTLLYNGQINYIQEEASRQYTVTAGVGNYVINQTRRYFNYQPGKSQLVLLTGIMSIESGTTKRIGIFDSDTGGTYQIKNGLYFETDGTDVSINVVKNGTTPNKIIQSNWNVDKFNGSGGTSNPSNIKLDLTKSQIFVIDFEWLGVGRVRFGFNIDGVIYYCHEVLHANNIEGVYMSYPNLPIRYELRSDGGSGTLTQICSSVSSEGGLDPIGVTRSVTTINAGISIGASEYGIVNAIRLKKDYFNIMILLQSMSLISANKGSLKWRLRFYRGDESINRNGVITQWEDITFSGLTNSAIEYKYDFLATDTPIETEGLTLYSDLASSGVGGITGDVLLTNSVLLGSKINRDMDVMTIEVYNMSVADDFWGLINWREV